MFHPIFIGQKLVIIDITISSFWRFECGDFWFEILDSTEVS